MSTIDSWIARFKVELERRGSSEDQICEQVSAVREHIRKGQEDPYTTFGDPVAYAAGLNTVLDDDTPPPTTIMTLFATITFFTVFVISSIHWIKNRSEISPWVIIGGIGLLLSVTTLSISLSRHAIKSALSHNSDQRNTTCWKLSATIAGLIPWSFIGFAGLVIAISTLI